MSLTSNRLIQATSTTANKPFLATNNADYVQKVSVASGRGFCFSPSAGSRFWTSDGNTVIRQYDTSSALSLTGATLDTTQDISAQIGTDDIEDIAVWDTHLYVLTTNFFSVTCKIWQYDLGSAEDISSLTYVDAVEIGLNDALFLNLAKDRDNNNGGETIWLGRFNSTTTHVHKFTFGTDYDISTLSSSGSYVFTSYLPTYINSGGFVVDSFSTSESAGFYYNTSGALVWVHRGTVSAKNLLPTTLFNSPAFPFLLRTNSDLDKISTPAILGADYFSEGKAFVFIAGGNVYEYDNKSGTSDDDYGFISTLTNTAYETENAVAGAINFTTFNFSDNGKYAIMVRESGTDTIMTVACDDAYDPPMDGTNISSFDFTSATPWTNNPTSVQVDPTGLIYLIAAKDTDGTDQEVYTVTLDGTGFLPGTATTQTYATLDLSSDLTTDEVPSCAKFDRTGYKLFVMTCAEDSDATGRSNFYEYPLSTAWDITSAGSYTTKTQYEKVNISAHFDFSKDGTRLYIYDQIAANVHIHELETAFTLPSVDITTDFPIINMGQFILYDPWNERPTEAIGVSVDNTEIFFYRSRNADTTLGAADPTLFRIPLT
jgi:hypothetical protein